MKRLMVVALLVVLAGCSPTRQIANSLTAITDAAVGIQADMTEATATYEAGGDPRPQHEDAYGKAGNIRTEAAKGHRALPGAEDETPWWGKLMTWGVVLGVLLVVAFLLWRTGLLSLIGAAIMALRVRWTPTVALQGEALAKLEAGQMSPREYTAAERAASPVNNAAYDAAKAKLKAPKA